MAIAELLPQIHELSRMDKFRILHFITSELSAEEETALFPGSEYPVWSPIGAEGAGADLLDFLSTAENQPA